MPAPTVFLDINETLLDLTALDPLFAGAFGEARARQEWFSLLLQLALTQTVTGDYRDFSALGKAALQALAQQRGVPLPSDLPGALAAGIGSLPPHPDTLAALEALKAGGARLVALGNSPLAVIERQLQNAGLREQIERVLSADAARSLKPAGGAYAYALSEVGAQAADSWMVAAHGWDISGARAAGIRTAFVERPGQSQNPFAEAELSGTLAELVPGILAG